MSRCVSSLLKTDSGHLSAFFVVRRSGGVRVLKQLKKVEISQSGLWQEERRPATGSNAGGFFFRKHKLKAFAPAFVIS